jgi:VIT1/CCC1 family predicted Fe2+/Mn2+ transporter
MAGFVHRDIVIHDPTVTDCGRFPVKPDFYNMNDTQVIAMLRLNAGIEAAAEAALHAGAKAIQRHLELSIEEPSKELFNTENRILTERIVLRYALDEIARRQGA